MIIDRTRIDADILYEKSGADLYGDGIVRLAHGGKKWEFKAEIKLRVNRAPSLYGSRELTEPVKGCWSPILLIPSLRK